MKSTIGKVFGHIQWLVILNVIYVVVAALSQHPELISPKVQGLLALIDLLLVTIINYFNPNVPNLPKTTN